jgi:hypothetical protein
MKRIFIPTQTASDWQLLLAKPVAHWKPAKSAMTAAAAWEAANGELPPEIQVVMDGCQLAELQGLRLIAALPEWQVALPGGDRPSCTDILALARNDAGLCVLAVEAKVDEDFGPLVAEKRKDASAGQLERIRYLEDLLGVQGFDDGIRYQLLHRTASAILAARQFHAATAVMLIQSFGNRAEIKADFEAFAHALSAQAVGHGLMLVPGLANPKLLLGWCQGAPRFLNTVVPPLAEYSVAQMS